MKYFVQVQYKTANGVAIRYSTVEASSKEDAQKLTQSEIQKNQVVDVIVKEVEKKSSKSR